MRQRSGDALARRSPALRQRRRDWATEESGGDAAPVACPRATSLPADPWRAATTPPSCKRRASSAHLHVVDLSARRGDGGGDVVDDLGGLRHLAGGVLLNGPLRADGAARRSTAGSRRRPTESLTSPTFHLAEPGGFHLLLSQAAFGPAPSWAAVPAHLEGLVDAQGVLPRLGAQARVAAAGVQARRGNRGRREGAVGGRCGCPGQRATPASNERRWVCVPSGGGKR